MEQPICGTLTKFNPELDKPVNVTALLEERHITYAVQSITVGLKDYCSGFSSSVESSATIHRSSSYLWISIGKVPLSKKLKEAIHRKFQTDNGNLLFYNWEQMKAEHPDISNFRYLHTSCPAFVGFPLPEEDSSEN